MLCIAFLPGIWFLARYIVSRSALQRDAAGIVPGLALALWILSVHVSGLLLKDFYQGMAMGTIPLGCLGYVTLARCTIPPERVYVYPRSLWWSAIIGTLILLPAVVLMDNWDKLMIITGHFSITEEMVNGIYPPRHLTFTDVVLPYHYGVDTLFAMVRVVFRLRVDVAIDLVTTVLFFYTILLYGHIGVRLFGEKVGSLAGFLGAFASGFPSIFGFNNMPPSVTSNWFQQPWTLGIPMFLTLFLVLINIDLKKQAPRSSLLIITIITIVLGMAQTALYGIFVPSILGWVTIAWLRTMGKTLKRPYHLIDIAFAVVAGAFISLCVSETSSLIVNAVSESIIPRSEHQEGSWSGMVLWNLQCFSIPLLFGIAGMIRARRMIMPSLIMTLGALFVFNRYTYAYSWDIVKFTQVAWLPLAIFASGYLGYLITHSRFLIRTAAIIPAVCLIVASMSSLWQFSAEGYDAWKYGTNPSGHTAFWIQFSQKNIPQDFIDALAWVRQRVNAGEITLLSSEDRTYDAAVLAGLPVLLPGWGDSSLGFPDGNINRRVQLAQNISQEMYVEYVNEGVRWMVLSPESNFVTQVDTWLWQGAITQVAEFGETRVYEFNVPSMLES